MSTGSLFRVNRSRAAGLCIALLALSGCATSTGTYDWGRYEDSLYLRYAEQDFGQAQREVYEMLPQPGHPRRVPPGVYADYGFLLYRRGDRDGAIAYFEREKAAFPESALLMNKLIERVKQQPGQGKPSDNRLAPPAMTPPPGPAPATGRTGASGATKAEPPPRGAQP
jgi:hypothetical protein